MNTTAIFIWLITGSFGFAYFLYGKKRDRSVMLWSGVVLCVYPYFVENNALSIFIGAVFILLPIFIRS